MGRVGYSKRKLCCSEPTLLARESGAGRLQRTLRNLMVYLVYPHDSQILQR